MYIIIIIFNIIFNLIILFILFIILYINIIFIRARRKFINNFSSIPRIITSGEVINLQFGLEDILSPHLYIF